MIAVRLMKRIIKRATTPGALIAGTAFGTVYTIVRGIRQSRAKRKVTRRK